MAVITVPDEIEGARPSPGQKTLNYLWNHLARGEARLWPGGCPWAQAQGDPAEARARIEPWLETLGPRARKSLTRIADACAAHEDTTPWNSKAVESTLGERLFEHFQELGQGSLELPYGKQTLPLPDEIARAFHQLLHHVLRVEIRRSRSSS